MPAHCHFLMHMYMSKHLQIRIHNTACKKLIRKIIKDIEYLAKYCPLLQNMAGEITFPCFSQWNLQQLCVNHGYLWLTNCPAPGFRIVWLCIEISSCLEEHLDIDPTSAQTHTPRCNSPHKCTEIDYGSSEFHRVRKWSVRKKGILQLILVHNKIKDIHKKYLNISS